MSINKCNNTIAIKKHIAQHKTINIRIPHCFNPSTNSCPLKNTL